MKILLAWVAFIALVLGTVAGGPIMSLVCALLSFAVLIFINKGGRLL